MQNFNVAVPTSFDEDEQINPGNTLKIVRYLAENGVRSFLLCGSTGEQHSLTLSEKLELLHVLEETDWPSDHEFLFGVAGIRQADAVQLAKAIGESRKVSAIMAGFPPYIRPTQKEALHYAQSVIETAGKPALLYNNPSRTGFDLDIESVQELAKNDAVVALKEAGDPDKVTVLKKTIDKPFAFFMGGESDMIDKLDAGYDAHSSVWGNLFPADIKAILDTYLEGDREKALKLYGKLSAFLDSIKANSPLPFIKARLREKNVPAGICRLPLGGAQNEPS